MPLANFDGQNSFTINGKTLTNRASSGATPIYDISSSGGSGGGSAISFEKISVTTYSFLDVDVSTGSLLEFKFSHLSGPSAWIVLDTLKVYAYNPSNSNSVMGYSGNSDIISGAWRTMAATSPGLLVRQIESGKIQLTGSGTGGSAMSILLLRHG